ncbi:MAG TPA: thiamine pyrophosphate-binding protein [Burkholderiales bacterium]|nr:thiamine pyrophosphate-binding protein [Burkholderiales bacterium]
MKIAEYLLQALESNGVKFIFGNPGTTEIPLVRACEGRPGIQYVVSLSEVSAVPMADGYARATRSLGVVNLHVAPGLGNGMGGLYTAGIAQSPLLVLVGGQDLRMLHTGPILWGPVEQMARSVAKAVFSINGTHDAAAAIHQAIRSALNRPGGPVVLICPPNVLEDEIEALPHKVQPPVLSGLSEATAEKYAQALCDAKHPAIIAAEDVHWDRANQALEDLAARIGAKIYAAPYTAALPVPADSPHFAGYLPPSQKQMAERLAAHDLLFFVGGTSMRRTLYSEAALDQPKLWVGGDARILAADGEYALATVADTRMALLDITRALGAPTAPAASHPPAQKLALPPAPAAGLHPTRAVAALTEAFAKAIWVDESGLSTSDVRQLVRAQAGEYLINGSGGIGWGLAASVGAALGHPQRQVVAIIGDGSALYASEALWAAGHQGTRLLLVILSNGRYATLNEAASRLTGGPLGLFSIDQPALNFEGLALLYGWAYQAVATESALTTFLEGCGGRIEQNTLLDLRLDPDIKPVTAARHF